MIIPDTDALLSTDLHNAPVNYTYGGYLQPTDVYYTKNLFQSFA